MGKFKSTTSEQMMIADLRRAYRLPEYAVLSQVPVRAVGLDGVERIRRADALVIGAWASRDQAILGFEIKSSRSSWLSEISDPQKADDVSAYCREFSVLSEPDIVKLEELPAGWGLAIPRSPGLKWIKRPTQKKQHVPTLDFFFSVFGCLLQQYSEKSIESIQKRAYAEGRRAGKTEAQEFLNETIEVLKRKYPDPLDGIRKLLISGPFELREERILLCEQVIKNIIHWRSVDPTREALKSIKFLSETGGVTLLSDLTSASVKLNALKNEVETLSQTLYGIKEGVRKAGLKNPGAL